MTALILVPGRWLLHYSGRPNRFKNPQPLKDPYRGKSAVVARALLERPAFHTVQDLHRYILDRGGELSQPLVSSSSVGTRWWARRGRTGSTCSSPNGCWSV